MNKVGMKTCINQRNEIKWLWLITKGTSCKNKTGLFVSRPGSLYSDKTPAQMPDLQNSLCFKEESANRIMSHHICHSTSCQPNRKTDCSFKDMDIPNKEKTSSISLHWRFMEAEVHQILEQRTSKQQLLTPRGYKISTCEVVCYHQQEPGAQLTATDTIRDTSYPTSTPRNVLVSESTQVRAWVNEMCDRV